MSLALAAPRTLPGAQEVLDRSGGENFPVALRLLARAHRRRLMAIYGFARLVDQLGDDYQGDRLAALDWLEQELQRAFDGTARHPLMLTLQQSLREGPLPCEPFRRLIRANRLDQSVTRYETFAQLRSYCELSANPVGELVLHVFGLATPARIELSDRVCTALQLAEHCQDVVEDLARGRVYMPAEDLRRFDVDVERVGDGDPQLRDRMRALIAFQVARARSVLRQGEPLVRTVSGRPRVAVAAFVAGGHSALDAIARADHDVLAGPPRAARTRLLWRLAHVLAGRAR